MDNKQEVSHHTRYTVYFFSLCSSQLIDIIETVYRGASKGRGLVVSPKGEPGSKYMLLGLSD